MILFQIIERPGGDLQRSLLESMRSGALQTFRASKHGRKISHVKHPGWINWSKSSGVITCELLSPRKPESEWQLLHAFLGRLAARFAASIVAINIQFSEPAPVKGRRGRAR